MSRARNFKRRFPVWQCCSICVVDCMQAVGTVWKHLNPTFSQNLLEAVSSGMAKATRKTAQLGSSKSKDLSPSKVLAIVANWNNTSPNKESPKRKRSRDDKLSASVPRSRRQKRKDYLSASSDEDDLSSFRAKPFYSSAKPDRYMSPYERKEERDRLIDAGVDPQTLNRSFGDLHGDRSRSRSVPRDLPAKQSQSAKNNSKPSASHDANKQATEKRLPTNNRQKESTAVDRRNPQVQSARQRSEVKGEIRVTLSESSPPGHVQRRISPRKAKASPMRRQEVKGESKVTLSESSPSGRLQRRISPKKSEPSPAKNVQRRISPRKQPQKPLATKGIQMYVKNLKNSQKKGKKPSSNQKAKKNQNAEVVKKTKSSDKMTKKTPKGAKDVSDQDASPTEKTARGLDFGLGASAVNGCDVAPLDRSFDRGEEEKVVEGPEENGEFMDFLVFHDEDFHNNHDPAGRETEDFVQNLLMEIDEDLEEAEAAVKRSPRKRKMKTEQESMASPTSKKGTPKRQRQSSTPLSSKKRSQPKLDDWLTLLGSQPAKSPNKKSTVQRSGVKGQATELLTPESSGTASPKGLAASPPTKPKLYPVFTPPTSPTARQNGTPSSLKKKMKKGVVSKVNSPKETSRSPLLKSLKSKNDSLEQMTLDLGQKRFGAVTCNTCGTVYTAAHPEDETDHRKFHKKYLSSIKFPGWKQEEVVEEFHDGRIIVVTQESPRFAEKKVDEIRELVDRELGFLEGNPIAARDLCKTYLFITSDKKVGGCLIAEQITKGYRVIVEDQRTTEGAVNESQKAWCCETESEPALCGVSRIWVPMGNRRKGIASRMVDCVRKNFMFGMILIPDDIAFSDPTPDGKIFATKYTGTPRFLVYKYR